MNAVLLERLDHVRDCLPVTPVVRLPHERIDLFGKLEFTNPNGSMKDRSSYWILKRAIERGEIRPETTVVESSSGNFAMSTAAFCKELHLPFIAVIDPNTNAATEEFLKASCKRVFKVAELDETGGFLRARLDRVRQLCQDIPAAYWPNQYGNPDGAQGHERLTGEELCGAIGHIDYLFVGVGTGATIAGLSRRIKMAHPRARVIAVDADGSAIFGHPPKRRHLPGIGSSIHPTAVDTAEIDDVIVISEYDAVRACHTLLNQYGLFTGGSTGSVYAAIERYFADYHGPRPTVAFLCADRGAPYSQTIYNQKWIEHVFFGVPLKDAV
jgi:2,3-diaminopropionate biosynthesis protein SbnA